MKTSNLNPNQDVYLRPKPQRHFKQAKFLTYFADQVQSFMPVIASLHPGGCGGGPSFTRMVLSHCWGESKDDSVGPWDLVAFCGVLTEHSHTSGSPQLSSVVAQFLGNLPMTPTASLCSRGNWSSPVGRAQHLIPQLIKREETIRKKALPPSIPASGVPPRTRLTPASRKWQGSSSAAGSSPCSLQQLSSRWWLVTSLCLPNKIALL